MLANLLSLGLSKDVSCHALTSARILSLNTVYVFRERGPAIAGFKRDRCVVAVSSAAMSDVKFWDAGGGNSITPT